MVAYNVPLLVERINPAPADWNGLVCACGGASLLQTWEYGALKAEGRRRTAEHLIVRSGLNVVGYALAIVVRPPMGIPGGFAWINRGPVRTTDPMADSIPEQVLLEAIVSHYSSQIGFYVRIAPASVVDSLDIGPGPSALQITDVMGWASARLDLSLPADLLRSRLRSNWRYSLRKMEKAEIKIDFGFDQDRFAQFISNQRQFLEDRAFTTSLTPDFLQKLQDMLPEDHKMIVFSAFDGAIHLGSILIARYGSICEYLAGNTAPTLAPGNGVGQFLLWNAVLEMQRRGYATFDLGGMDPDRTPKGIFDFKSGVKAIPYRLKNEIEAGGRWPIGKLIKLAVARARRLA